MHILFEHVSNIHLKLTMRNFKSKLEGNTVVDKRGFHNRDSLKIVRTDRERSKLLLIAVSSRAGSEGDDA